MRNKLTEAYEMEWVSVPVQNTSPHSPFVRREAKRKEMKKYNNELRSYNIIIIRWFSVMFSWWIRRIVGIRMCNPTIRRDHEWGSTGGLSISSAWNLNWNKRQINSVRYTDHDCSPWFHMIIWRFKFRTINENTKKIKQTHTHKVAPIKSHHLALSLSLSLYVFPSDTGSDTVSQITIIVQRVRLIYWEKKKQKRSNLNAKFSVCACFDGCRFAEYFLTRFNIYIFMKW